MTHAGRRIVGGVIGLVLLASVRAAQEVRAREAEFARVVAEVEELAFAVPGRAVRRAEEGLVEFAGVGAAELARLQLARGVPAQIDGQFDSALGHYRAALAEAGGERRTEAS